MTEKAAEVDNFDWKPEWNITGGKITAQDDNSVTFTIASGEPGQAVAVGVKNNYTAKRGSFEIVKSLSGEAAAAAANTDFKFNYSCVVGDEVVVSGEKTITGAGSATVDDVPLISDCTVTESDATVPDTSVQPTITPEEFKLLDESGKPVEVTVNADNNYTYVDGGFTITKQVEGNAVSFAPDTFTMNYECEAPSTAGEDAEPVSGSVDLEAGQSTTIPNVIPGSNCKVWENDAPAKNGTGIFGSSTNTPGASWENYYEVNGVKADPAEFIVESEKNTQVTVTNVYNKEGKPGLIIIPIPIPFPIPGGGSSTPPGGGSSVTPPGSSTPTNPATPVQPTTPVQPSTPAQPATPEQPANTGTPAKGQPAAQGQKSTPSKSLANTGANVAWIGGIALLLLIAGAWLSMRKRRES